MTELEKQIENNASLDAGMQAFAKEAASFYAQRDAKSLGFSREVVCHWVARCASKTSTLLTLLFLPLVVIGGHGAARLRQINFTTYHYLNPSEYRRMKRLADAKTFITLLGVGAVMFTGFFLVLSVIGLAVALFSSTEQGQQPMGWLPPLIAFISIGVILWCAVRFQRWLWKVGEPPAASIFADSRIRLERTEFR